jgi:putative membrane protein
MLLYQSFKWLHIVSVISWMAGILYLFRLFIYHAEKGRDDLKIHDLLSLMELRLYKYITVPAMLVAWVAGLGIVATTPSLGAAGWFHAKLLFVIILTITTTKAGKMRRRFAVMEDPVPTSKSLRWLNELPTVLMLIIVALVVFKPF